MYVRSSWFMAIALSVMVFATDLFYREDIYHCMSNLTGVGSFVVNIVVFIIKLFHREDNISYLCMPSPINVCCLWLIL